MKKGKHLFGSIGGELREDCYGVYGDYFVKYLKENSNRGSPIYAITPQNEPGLNLNYPGLIMNAQQQLVFIRDHLGPKIKAAGLNTKILAWDFNYDGAASFMNTIYSDANTNNYVAGTALHHYTTASYTLVNDLHNKYPNKDIWFTECGFGTWVGK